MAEDQKLEQLEEQKYEKKELVTESKIDRQKLDEIIEQIVTENQHKIKINVIAGCLPLHRFTNDDICNTIQKWIYSDIKYNTNLKKTMKILSKHRLSGNIVTVLPVSSIKIMLQSDLDFMTPQTLNIIFDNLEKWINDNKNIVEQNSPAEIGYKMYNFPVIDLLNRIKEDKIDGAKFIRWYIEGNDWLKDATGWDLKDIYQVQAVLFKNNVNTEAEIKHNLTTTLEKRFPKKLSELIVSEITAKFNVEELQFKIKTGHNIQEFSDFVVNMIDELGIQNEQKKQQNDEDEEKEENKMKDLFKLVSTDLVHESIKDNNDFVKQMYESIAQGFVFQIHTRRRRNDLSLYILDQHQDWVCNNCGNYNFHYYIDGDINTNLENCKLCGITRVESNVAALKNSDTYVMVHDAHGKQDETNLSIQDVPAADQFNLTCPNRNDNKPCQSILKLAKQLIFYKHWINFIDKNKSDDWSIDSTVDVDVQKYVNSEMFRDIFIDSAAQIPRSSKNEKYYDNIIPDLKQIVTDDTNVFKACKTNNRKTFIKIIKKKTSLITSEITKLWKFIQIDMKKKAQIEQFGRFVSDFDADNVIRDYHHILSVHIKNGTKTTIENVFRFFETSIHFDDKASHVKKQCRSLTRKEQRFVVYEAKVDEENKEDEHIEDESKIQNEYTKNIWNLKQYWIQSQLDVIHTYLVHSNWKAYIHRYVTQKDANIDISAMEYDEKLAVPITNNHKYTSNDSDFVKYGFGVDHDHPYLKPEWKCLRDEILHSKAAISANKFDTQLTKAIKLLELAINGEYKNKFVCKYFKYEYNILRNESIGIRHVLAIILYTDMSEFCTDFRSTYRQINDEIDDDQVVKRHIQLYFYARCLSEAIEFFGEEMNTKTTVFHGLNCPMKFEHFNTYFHQPISTTTDKNVAKSFSTGFGIILVLKSGVKKSVSTSPKYLEVSLLSDFPHEAESLFYGSNTVFEIHNIIESANNKGHLQELKMLNKFQRTVTGQQVKWNEAKMKEMIDTLVTLIENRQDRVKQSQLNACNNDEIESIDTFPIDKIGLIDEKQIQKVDKKEENETNSVVSLNYEDIEDYGERLFHYFCDSINKWVCIQNYMSLPVGLKRSLLYFKSDTSDDKKQEIKEKAQEYHFSIIKMAELFPNATEIILNEINIQQLIQRKKDFAAAIMKYINKTQDNECIYNVVKIVFESSTQVHRKQNPTLKKLAKQYAPKFNARGWNFKYSFGLEEKHSLIFTKEPLQAMMTDLHLDDEKKQVDEIGMEGEEETVGCFHVFATISEAISSKWKGTQIGYTTVSDKDSDKDSDSESRLDFTAVEINSDMRRAEMVTAPGKLATDYLAIEKKTRLFGIPLFVAIIIVTLSTLLVHFLTDQTEISAIVYFFIIFAVNLIGSCVGLVGVYNWGPVSEVINFFQQQNETFGSNIKQLNQIQVLLKKEVQAIQFSISKTTQTNHDLEQNLSQFDKLESELRMACDQNVNLVDFLDEVNKQCADLKQITYQNEKTQLLSIYLEISSRCSKRFGQASLTKDGYNRFLSRLNNVTRNEFELQGGFEVMDTNGDGRVDVEEFEKMFDVVWDSIEDEFLHIPDRLW
eukprot:169716_1